MKIFINVCVVTSLLLFSNCMLPYTAYTVLPMKSTGGNGLYYIYFTDLKEIDQSTGYTKILVSFGSSSDSIIKIELQDIDVIVRNKEYKLISEIKQEIILVGNGNGINRRYSGYWQSDRKIVLPYALSKGEILVSISYQMVMKSNKTISGHINESFYINKKEGYTPLISH